MSNYYNRFIKCPFFKKNEKDRVICERSCRVVFADYFEIKGWMDTYCDSEDGWKKCSIAQMLEDYYTWEEEND